MTYLNRNLGTKQTPQNEKIPGSTQVPNSAGGFAWQVDDWKRLDRFLILGSEGGSYYTNERELTKDNIEGVLRCINSDGQRVISRVVEISEAGRAPKNDQALFVLAACSSAKDIKTRMSALEALPRVARIGTHLMHFVSYAEQFRGWGRGLRLAVGNWYNDKSPDKLAFQVVKYQQRDKWSNADLLRLSHPIPPSDDHKRIYKWVVDGELLDDVEDLIVGFSKAQTTTDEKELIGLITKYKLTMEMIPTQFHNSPNVWEAILPNLGLTAIIRNLGNMSKCGFLMDGKWSATNDVCSRITNADDLKKSRVHPIAILSALCTYKSGHGLRGKGEWPVSGIVVDALDQAFYLAFGNVEPTNKRLVLALDVSGSMGGGAVAGIEGLTPRLVSAAMAMVTLKADSRVVLVAFSTQMMELGGLGKLSRISEVEHAISHLPFMGTDCSLPMRWALTNKIEADAFVVYTDSETWYGDIHPKQALDMYRQKTGIPAKLIVVGMVSNEFSIADPDDSGMLDVVGFDTAAPEVMSGFIRE